MRLAPIFPSALQRCNWCDSFVKQWTEHCASLPRPATCHRLACSVLILTLPPVLYCCTACPSEQARIQQAGGQVVYHNGCRVMGALAMSRAIGDHALRPYGELRTVLAGTLIWAVLLPAICCCHTLHPSQHLYPCSHYVAAATFPLFGLQLFVSLIIQGLM